MPTLITSQNKTDTMIRIFNSGFHMARLVNSKCTTRHLPTRMHSSSFSTPTASSAASATGSSTTSSSSAPANVIQALKQRGLLQDSTGPELELLTTKKSISVYCGFDPTAESLHLGNLLGIIVLSWFQRYGHTPVALIGGATGRVGDPSGKSAERPVLADEAIERNVKGIETILHRLLSLSTNNGPGNGGTPQQPVKIVNNLDWLGNMGLLEFLRDVGKYARVGTMLAKDSVKTRLDSESGMSYTEFTYQLLQGYDFVHLARAHGVQVQIGGSDQWGNIIAGTELIRKTLDDNDNDNGDNTSVNDMTCHGMTFPLLLKADGTKFGKSESGAVWLAAEALSPYKFYQFLFSTADVDVIRLLKSLTFLPLEEIQEIEASMSDSGYIPNTAQKRLAEEVTQFVHGEAGLAQALKATAALAPGASSTELDAATLLESDVPQASLPRDQVVGVFLSEVMVAVGMQPSKGAVRRMIKNGGVKMNNVKVEDDEVQVREEDLVEGKLLLLTAGKKNKVMVKVEV